MKQRKEINVVVVVVVVVVAAAKCITDVQSHFTVW